MVGILSLLVLGTELTALVLFLRHRVVLSALRWYLVAFLVGTLGIPWVWSVRYPYNAEYTAIGFPIPGVMFEVTTGADFVSPYTLHILIFDSFAVPAFPAAALMIIVALRNRPSLTVKTH